MAKSSSVPPLPWLVAAAARNLSVDETQPHLYSPVNYLAGVAMVFICCRAYAEAKIQEAR
jgi:hypothetical protein